MLKLGLAGVPTLKTEFVVRKFDELSEEVSRIESLIRSVDRSLADQHTPLAEVVRLTNWKGQLEAYLQGIRFALGEAERFTAEGRWKSGSQ